MRFSAGALEHVMECECPFRSQDARNFSIKLRFIFNIHLRMLGPYDVKRIVIKGKIEGTSLVKCHGLAQSNECCKGGGDIDIFASEVDTCCVTAVLPSRAIEGLKPVCEIRKDSPIAVRESREKGSFQSHRGPLP